MMHAAFFAGARVGVYGNHGRNNFARFLDQDTITDADVLAPDFVFVVQGRARDGGSGELHRLQLGDRRELAGACCPVAGG
mgnify:CR=1 FL=1